MMHGDSRVMVVVCLETASLPAPCLSTSTSPRSREEPFKRVHMRDTIKVLLLLGASFALVALEKTPGERALFSGLLAVMGMGVTLLKPTPRLQSVYPANFQSFGWRQKSGCLCWWVQRSTSVTFSPPG